MFMVLGVGCGVWGVGCRLVGMMLYMVRCRVVVMMLYMAGGSTTSTRLLMQL